MINIKKSVFIFSIIFIIVLIISVILLPQNNKNQSHIILPTPSLIPVPFPSLVPNATGPALPGVAVPSGESQILRQEKTVGRLLDILPVTEKNFSFRYNYQEDIFFLSLNSLNLNQANIDFDVFLQKNGVENRSWVENLEVESENPNPAP